MAERADLQSDARSRASPSRPNLSVIDGAGPGIADHASIDVAIRGRPGRLRPQQLLAMQRLAGNQAVLEVLGGRGRRDGATSPEDEDAVAGTSSAAEPAIAGGVSAAGFSPPDGSSGSGGIAGEAAGAAGAAAAEGAAGAGEAAASEAIATAAASDAPETASTAAGQAVETADGPGAQAGLGQRPAAQPAGASMPEAGAVEVAHAPGGQAGAAGGEAPPIADVAQGAAGLEAAGAAGGEAPPIADVAQGAAGLEAPGAAGGEAAGAAGATQAAARADQGQPASAEVPMAAAPHPGELAAEGDGAERSPVPATPGEGAGPTGAEAPAGGGGGGIDLDAPVPAGEPLPDPSLPAAPAAGEINRLGETPDEPEAEDAPAAADVEVEEESPAGEIEGQAAAVENAGRDTGGGGGLVDAIVSRAKSAFRSVASSVTGATRGVATTVAGVVRGAVQGARTLARSIVDGIVSTARSIKTAVATGVRSVVNSVMATARGLVSRLLRRVSGVMGSVRGAVMAAIGRALRGEPLVPSLLAPVTALLHRLFDDIPNQVTRVVIQLTQRANSLVDRLIGGISALSQRASAGVAGLAATLQGAVARAASTIAALAGRAASLVAGLPALFRPVVGWLADRLLAGVRAAVRVIGGIVNRAIARISTRIQAWISRKADAVIGLIGRARARVIAIVQRAANLVRAGLSRLRTFRDWLVRSAKAALGRVLRSVLSPIQRGLMALLVRLIGPHVQQAIEKARLLFPSGMPTPPTLTEAQRQAAVEMASSAAESIKAGILHPEGDHFSVGFSIGGTVGDVVGASAAAGASLEVVMDYRRNDIGFFVAPGAGIQGSIGTVGGTANETYGQTWGTVGSFGGANKDVLQGWGGWFTTASYGLQAGAAAELGVAVSSGGAVSVGGSYDGDTLFSYVPLGADTDLVPGQPVATSGAPGVSPADTQVMLGRVLFPVSSDDVSALGGTGAVSSAATTATGWPEAHPGERMTGITVTGHSSRGWRHPVAGQGRASLNADLATRRAARVRDALAPMVRGMPVNSGGAGDLAAARAGKPETDLSPEDQNATMVGTAHREGRPPGAGPAVGAPERRRQAFDVKGSLPNPLAAGRSAWGWDTTIGVSAQEGAGGQVAGYLGLGVSYSFPLGKAHFSPTTMALIRVVFGLAKVVGDLETLSFLGVVRDAIGMGWGVEALVTGGIGQAVSDWALPLPNGVAAA